MSLDGRSLFTRLAYGISGPLSKQTQHEACETSTPDFGFVVEARTLQRQCESEEADIASAGAVNRDARSRLSDIGRGVRVSKNLVLRSIVQIFYPKQPSSRRHSDFLYGSS